MMYGGAVVFGAGPNGACECAWNYGMGVCEPFSTTCAEDYSDNCQSKTSLSTCEDPCQCLCNDLTCSGFTNNCDDSGTNDCGVCYRSAPVSGACEIGSDCFNNNVCRGIVDPLYYQLCSVGWLETQPEYCKCSNFEFVYDAACDCDASKDMCDNPDMCGSGNSWIYASASATGMSRCCGDDSDEGSLKYVASEDIGYEGLYDYDECGTLDSSITDGECDLGLAE